MANIAIKLGAKSRVLAVRRDPTSVTWHLVDGRPLDGALCGEARPRRGWWDLGPRTWARPTETCIGCLERFDELVAREEAPHGQQ